MKATMHLTRGARVVAPSRAGRPGRLRRPAVGALAVAVVLAGAGTAAAGGWLQTVRTEGAAPVGSSTSGLLAVPDLGAYGELTVTRGPDVHRAPSASAAAAETGLDVPDVASLPRGVSGEPVYHVGGELRATFTFSAERAARAAVAAGATPPPPPPGVDGAQVRLAAGPGVVATWSRAAGVPALVVGRAVAPTVSSSEAPFETVRDHLLSLPGLPEGVAAQLRTFTGDGSTLPLPVPGGRFSTSSADVGGTPATVLATRDRALAAVVWVDDGVVTVVAGALGPREVLAVARELR